MTTRLQIMTIANLISLGKWTPHSAIDLAHEWQVSTAEVQDLASRVATAMVTAREQS